MLLLTHFGAVADPGWHLDDLAARLSDWTRRAGEGTDRAALAAALQADGDAQLLAATGNAALVRRYAESIPYEMMAAGLLRQAHPRPSTPSRD
jgi:hypothetical protein